VLRAVAVFAIMLSFSLFGLAALPTILAQDTVLSETIWSTVMYTMYGDRTPYIAPDTTVLTPLGAQQLLSVGSTFRDRYINPPSGSSSTNTAIQGISQFQLDVDQLTMISTADQFIVAGAQAFMQGLYPPLQQSSNLTFINSNSELSNGSNIDFPFNGYQYPQIYTASDLDLNSIWIAGEINCPEYTSSRQDYFISPEYENTQTSTAGFYSSLQSKFLEGVFSDSSVGYFDAYYIWDYLQYGATHNTSVSKHISPDELFQARVLADQWVFAMNGNTTASGITPGDSIRAVAGRTLATEVLEALYTNINSQGQLNKMTMMFGSFEPMVSFAALARLASQMNSDFYGQPQLGSSMVFELFSMVPGNGSNASTSYPDTKDLNVRFLFQNGTGSSAELISFPLFGRGPSQISMVLDDFINGMSEFTMDSVESWCDACQSFSVFCPAFSDENTDNSTTDGDDSGSDSGSKSHHRVSAAVGGVIGAVVTLAVIGLVAAAVMLLGGFRVYRQHTKKRSDLNGFKGGEKLASDQDLTLPKGGAGASVTPAGPARGHERVGSWELKSQRMAEEAQMGRLGPDATPGRPSFEDDDLRVMPSAQPVKTHDAV